MQPGAQHSRTFWIGMALAAAILAASPREAAPAAKAAQPGRSRTNLVLVTLDTTRADHLGAWGWPHAKTPNLDALARRGTRFVRCDTAAPVTLPSHATILTGLFPPRHGVRDNGTFSLAGKVETVAERLARQGYDTGAVVSAVVLARRHGLDQGFRIYNDDLEQGYAAGSLVAERSAEKTTAQAVELISQLRAPYFLWVHYYDPHEEYRPPSRIADAAQGPNRLYDGEITFMDQQIGELLAKLSKDTAVIAVGDHGEMLGQHGEQTHGLLLFEGARRVPLILAGPGVPAGATSDCLARTADVAPTLLQLAGLAAPAGLDGRSLLPLERGAACSRRSYSESFLPFFAYKWYPLRGLSNGRFFYLHAPRPGLYDLAQDAGETRDLGPSQPRAAQTWRGELQKLLRQQGEELDPKLRPENQLSEEQRRQLASLGYAGGTAGGTVSPNLPDPRAMTDVASTLHRVAAEVQEGKCTSALPQLNAIVKRDPHNFPALSLAGYCLREAGRNADALVLFQRATQENDLSAVPIADAAGCLLDLGRPKEAEREFRRALALDPSLGSAAAALAQLVRKRGEPAEAEKILDAVLAAGSHEPAVYLERGTARGERGNLAEAMADFREAYRRDPKNPIPLENAARSAYRLGRFRESAQLYEQLLRINSSRGDLWKTLGAIYLYDLGDEANALPAFRRALLLEGSAEERAKLEALVRELGG